MDTVSFALEEIQTVEFAVLKEAFDPEEQNIDYRFNVNFGIKSTHDHTVMCSPEVSFCQNDAVFLKIKIACYFDVHQSSWDKYIQADNTVVFPKDFTDHLLMLSTGTLRGALHAKTEGTVFNKFFLPTINVSELYDGDIEIKAE